MESNKENTIVASICLIFFVIIVILFWKSPIATPATEIKKAEILVRAENHMTGRKEAKVTLVEFGDYQCPACAIVGKEITKVLDAYKTNPEFNYVFRNFPLQQHKNAVAAAEAAESAGAQGKYFEMEDILYANQSEWSESLEPLTFFKKYAEGMDLDMVKFNDNMSSHAWRSRIDADSADGNAIEINHTPTIYINGVEQTDNSFEALKKAIDSNLNK